MSPANFSLRLANLVAGVLLVCFGMLPEGLHAASSTPELREVRPRGVQRGHSQTIKLIGVRLDGAAEAFFYDRGIAVESLKQIDSKTVEVKLNVAKSCRLGEHVVQLRTLGGITEFRTLYVGQYPTVSEVEKNGDDDPPQPIELNQTVAGKIAGEDVDRFSLSLAAGQRLSVEIEAVRLGDFLDTQIELLNSHGRRIAFSDDSIVGNQDGWFSLVIPENDNYTIRVSDTSLSANGRSRYRLHVGDFPRPPWVFPPGGKPRETITVDLPGDMATRSPTRTPLQGTMVLPEQLLPFRTGVPISDSAGTSPSPVAVRVADLENLLVPDDANHVLAKDAIPVSVPVAINGRFVSGPFHWYRFSAKKNQNLAIDCFTRQIGSAMDPVINVFDMKQKVVGGNDDNRRRPDSLMYFKPPADGDYFLRVRDYAGRSGSELVYRIELKRRQPSIHLAVKRNDRYSQRRQAVAVPQGGRFAAIVTLSRSGINDAVSIDFGNPAGADGEENKLPAGVAVAAVQVPRGISEMPVVYEAENDAPLALTLTNPQLDLSGFKNSSGKPPSSALVHCMTRFWMAGLFSLASPNQSSYHECYVDRLPVGVIERLPFRVDVVQPTAMLFRNGTAKIRVRITRDEGFKERVRLHFPYRPPGVNTVNQVDVKPDQSEIDYPITANGKSQLGKWPFYVIATANVKGPAWTSSQLATIDIGEPVVAFRTDRVVCTQGDTASVESTVDHLKPFRGTATATIAGLPPGTSVKEPVTFDATTQEVTFQLVTTEKTPARNFASSYVEVRIPADGVGSQASVASAGKVLLRVRRKPAETVGGNDLTSDATGGR